MRRTSFPEALVVLFSIAAFACTPATPAPKGATAATTPRVPTDELHWVRGSAEYRAVMVQTFRAALEAAEEASAGRPAGSWAVSVDADETLLDNSGYELELQRQGLAHSDEAWKAWVERGQRPAIPGAAEFLSGVQKLGGRVAVVTNTVQSLRSHVAENLRAVSLPYDILVCRADDGDDRKEGRWKSVADGTARPELGPVEILVWVGDNIQDFPEQSQELRTKDEASFAEFGVRFFALPNPIYGTWEKNEPR
jgi:5'-nucleotidase (lipoprotein e(P4) family)